METLLAVLRLAHKTQNEVTVVKRLAEYCTTYPIECVECLRIIIECDEERWAMPLIEAGARDVLKLAMGSSIPQVILRARHLVQDLIKLGYYEFRTLLE